MLSPVQIVVLVDSRIKPQRLGVERLGLQPHQVVRFQRLRQLDSPAQLETERHIERDAHIRP